MNYLIQNAKTGYVLAPIDGRGFWSLVDNETGIVTNLSSLGVMITAYMGAGMAPLENITSDYGLKGGSFYQRTVFKARSIILVCTVEVANLSNVQRIRQQAISLLMPNRDLAIARNLSLRYQLVNDSGQPIGKILQCPVKFVGGLEGNTDNLYQDKFSLQFVELNPPSLTELTSTNVGLGYSQINTAPSGYVFKQDTIMGTWSRVQPPTVSVNCIYDAGGSVGILIGTSTGVIGLTNSAYTVVTGSSVHCFCEGYDGGIFAGGSFTIAGGAPADYLMYYSTTSNSWVSSPYGSNSTDLNGTVYALARYNVGDPSYEFIYVGGSFNLTDRVGLFGFSKTNGVHKITVNGTVYVLKFVFPSVFVGGSFTSITATRFFAGTTVTTAANNMALIRDIATAISSGTNGTVRTIEYLAGNYVIGGDFTIAGSVACNRVASLFNNLSQVVPMSSGLNGVVKSLSSSALVGGSPKIYAAGSFTGTGDGLTTFLSPLASWNGSYWEEVALQMSASTTINTVLSYAETDVNTPLYIGLASQRSISTSTPVITVVNYKGTSPVRPDFTIFGPGRLVSIKNLTTGKSLYFRECTLGPNQICTLKLSTPSPIFTSSVYGNILGKISPISNIADFYLILGDNTFSVLMDGTLDPATSGISVNYKNTHYSFDAGVTP